MAARPNPWLTAALLGAAALVPFLGRGLARFRLITGTQLVQTFLDPLRGHPKTPVIARVQAPESRMPAPQQPLRKEGGKEAPLAAPVQAPPEGRRRMPPLEQDGSAFLSDPGMELRRFQEALSRTEQGSGLTRILHFGDSVVTGDLITGEARARFQKAFGDGGPGWVYLQRPWEWYGRPGMTLKGSGWRIQAPVLSARKDHLYGLAGLAFASPGGAETSVVATRPFSTLEVHYQAQPRGGRLQLSVDKGTDLELSTTGSSEPVLKAFPMPSDAPHTIRLRAKGEVLLSGLVLERPGPGVVVDAIGSNGGAVQHLRGIAPESWIPALRLRRPDLVVLAFGTNEVGYYNIPGPAYAADYREVVRRIREALPSASILVMGPMDRGERRPDGSLGTMPNLIRIVAAQKRIAEELGVAFFDTYRAMGGEGSAVRWYLGAPRLMTGDLTHPTRTGADRLAALLVDALQRRYLAWKESAGPEQHAAPGEAGAKGGHHR